MAETCPASEVQCRLAVHSFCSMCNGKQVHFSVLKLKDSFMLWIGTKPAQLSNLAVAMKTIYDPAPCSSHLLGDTRNEISADLSKKLARRTGCQVLVSCNLPAGDDTLILEVEKQIITELRENADKFI